MATRPARERRMSFYYSIITVAIDAFIFFLIFISCVEEQGL